MNNKLTKAESTKAEITAAALELFFEKGYENTSIRMIQNKVGKEIGAFYYHFSSKDAVLEAAIDLFFHSYEARMKDILQAGEAKPEGELLAYLTYMEGAVQSFREEYLGKLHWSILGVIREHTLGIMRKYIRQILENYFKKGIISKPSLGLEVTANQLAYGIGGSMLYQNAAQYAEQKEEILKMIPMLLGISG